MGIISRTGDLFYAFRFLKLLVTPFEKTKAFELGIIDQEGNFRVLWRGYEWTYASLYHDIVLLL